MRIIAATNRDLQEMVERGEFREDLYYRINVINLTLPPLRERRDDIPLLIDHFLKRNAQGRRLKRSGCTPGAASQRMIAYPWPGNIRELENEIERLVVLAGDDKLIGEELLSPRIRQETPEDEPAATAQLAAGGGRGARAQHDLRGTETHPLEQDEGRRRAAHLAAQPHPQSREVQARPARGCDKRGRSYKDLT